MGDRGAFDAVPIVLPEARSHSPIIIRACPKVQLREEHDGSLNLYSEKGYQENGNFYFSKEKAIKCASAGGGDQVDSSLPISKANKVLTQNFNPSEKVFNLSHPP